MDTKLKNYNGKTLNSPGGWCYRLAWSLLIVSTVLTGIGATIQVALWEIKQWSIGAYGYYDDNQWIPYDSKWSDCISNLAEFHDTATFWGFMTVGQAVVSIVLLVLILVFTGRFNGNEDGSIALNWFDRIWSEIHVAVMFGFGAGFGLMLVPLYEILGADDWFGLYQPGDVNDALFGMSNELALSLIIVALVGSAIFCLTSLVSLVKKLKAHKFWEKSLIGSILLYIWRSLRESDSTAFKVSGFMVLLCAVAGFCGMQTFVHGWSNEIWILLGVVTCMALILFTVPNRARKFREIRRAAEEIRSGNLGYKIGVKPDCWGGMDELDRLAVDLNHIGEAQQIAVDNEMKNQRMKTELISNVSHDLKTPLTSMAAYIDLLKREGLNSENALEYLDIIDRKTQRLKVLTENLFEAAKASSGAIPVHLAELDLSALVSQSLAEMEEKLAVRNLQVIVRNECEADLNGCRVLADGQLLWRVIENILGNVSKYALNGSRVYVNLRKQQGKVILEVKNISADALNISADELMERFKRGDESRNTEGSGLGLSIARDLTALMKGSFEISIDGDLFKATVILDDAAESGFHDFAKSPSPGPFESQVVSAVQEVREAAGQAVGSAVTSMREKAKARKSERIARRAEQQQPLQPIFGDIPDAEFETAEQE